MCYRLRNGNRRERVERSRRRIGQVLCTTNKPGAIGFELNRGLLRRVREYNLCGKPIDDRLIGVKATHGSAVDGNSLQ